LKESKNKLKNKCKTKKPEPSSRQFQQSYFKGRVVIANNNDDNFELSNETTNINYGIEGPYWDIDKVEKPSVRTLKLLQRGIAKSKGRLELTENKITALESERVQKKEIERRLVLAEKREKAAKKRVLAQGKRFKTAERLVGLGKRRSNLDVRRLRSRVKRRRDTRERWIEMTEVLDKKSKQFSILKRRWKDLSRICYDNEDVLEFEKADRYLEKKTLARMEKKLEQLEFLANEAEIDLI